MSVFQLAAGRPLAGVLRVVFMFALAALSGCASYYVDGAVKEIPPSQYTRAAQPKPVQLVFEFQTKGVANARATQAVKPMVFDSIKASGLFADVQETPARGGALLSVTLNNIPLTDDAFAKGFMTGLTFGAAGSQVTDGYECTLKYVGASQAPITETAKHAIHTALGASGTPPDGVKVASVDEAVRTMVRQIISHVLSDLSKDAAFK